MTESVIVVTAGNVIESQPAHAEEQVAATNSVPAKQPKKSKLKQAQQLSLAKQPVLP